MKWRLTAIVLLLAGSVICAILFFNRTGRPARKNGKSEPVQATDANRLPVAKAPQTAPARGPREAAVEPAVPTAAPTNVISAAAANPANWPRSGPLGLPPDIVVRNARAAVTQYGSMFHGNPVGNNSEITSALNGNNPRHINFIGADSGLQINEKGEMVDAWGTPLFFHQLSARDMEIRSAGPDKVMWTSDDIVAR